jgi:hypothetical protein
MNIVWKLLYFYVYCFAHQLKFLVIFVASCCPSIHDFLLYFYDFEHPKFTI